MTDTISGVDLWSRWPKLLGLKLITQINSEELSSTLLGSCLSNNVSDALTAGEWKRHAHASFPQVRQYLASLTQAMPQLWQKFTGFAPRSPSISSTTTGTVGEMLDVDGIELLCAFVVGFSTSSVVFSVGTSSSSAGCTFFLCFFFKIAFLQTA